MHQATFPANLPKGGGSDGNATMKTSTPTVPPVIIWDAGSAVHTVSATVPPIHTVAPPSAVQLRYTNTIPRQAYWA